MDVEWKVQVDIIIIQVSQSLETYYKNKDIRAEEILKLTRQFLSVMEKERLYVRIQII